MQRRETGAALTPSPPAVFGSCAGMAFTGHTGDIVNTFEASGLAPGSTRAAASSKYPRSKSRTLTRQILSATSRMPTNCPLKAMLRLILRSIYRLCPHMLRHTSCTQLVRTNGLVTVQRFAGHASIYSTVRYVGMNPGEYE